MQREIRHRVSGLRAGSASASARICEIGLSVNSPGAGTSPPQFLATIAERTLGQIAEVVGEIRIDPR